MLSSKSKQGRKIADRSNPVLSHDAVKLLKTQDAGYLQMMIQKTRKAVERLEGDFVLGGEADEMHVFGQGISPAKKIVFVQDQEEQQAWNPENQIRSGTDNPAEGSDLEANGQDVVTGHQPSQPRISRKKIEKEQQIQKQGLLLREKNKKEQKARRTKLAALKAREKDLRTAENELELQRAKMSNAIGGVNKAGVKWKVRERKK